MEKEITILKLGGALLTDKSTPYTARDTIINAVAREIKECIDTGLIQSLILLHGVGSYGHPPVLKYKLHKGFQDPKQLIQLSKTHRIVNTFRDMIVISFQEVKLPVYLFYPSSLLVAEKMKPIKYFLEAVMGYSSLGMIPLLGGDMIYDRVMGWSVGSGDPLAFVISRELGAKRVIFATDVAGIYEADPKLHPDAHLLEEINLNEIGQTIDKLSSSGDASGRMKGKLSSMISAKDLIEKGLEVTIISMMEYGNLKALLKGETVQTTRIVVK